MAGKKPTTTKKTPTVKKKPGRPKANPNLVNVKYNSFTHLMIHCSATDSRTEVTPEMIRKWHIQGRGWSRVGYSMLFRRSGATDILIPWDKDDIIDSWEISNGAKGWNNRTKHFCYAGGAMIGNPNRGEDNRTREQKAAMQAAVELMIMLYPQIKLIGHNQVARKACPSFSVPAWADAIGIPDKNIDRNIYY